MNLQQCCRTEKYYVVKTEGNICHSNLLTSLVLSCHHVALILKVGTNFNTHKVTERTS